MTKLHHSLRKLMNLEKTMTKDYYDGQIKKNKKKIKKH